MKAVLEFDLPDEKEELDEILACSHNNGQWSRRQRFAPETRNIIAVGTRA